MMTKEEKLRIYNDCIHSVGCISTGTETHFCYYGDYDSPSLVVKKEHDYYCVDDYIMTNFKEVVAIVCRYCLSDIK